MKILSRGKLDLSDSEVKKYKSKKCKELMKDIGDFIKHEYPPNTEKNFWIVFFPDIFLFKKQLFYIEYDKNLVFKSFLKKEEKLPFKMSYLVLSV